MLVRLLHCFGAADDVGRRSQGRDGIDPAADPWQTEVSPYTTVCACSCRECRGRLWAGGTCVKSAPKCEIAFPRKGGSAHH